MPTATTDGRDESVDRPEKAASVSQRKTVPSSAPHDKVDGPVLVGHERAELAKTSRRAAQTSNFPSEGSTDAEDKEGNAEKEEEKTSEAEALFAEQRYDPTRTRRKDDENGIHGEEDEEPVLEPPTLADRLAIFPAALPPSAFAGICIREDASSLYPEWERSNLAKGPTRAQHDGTGDLRCSTAEYAPPAAEDQNERKERRKALEREFKTKVFATDELYPEWQKQRVGLVPKPSDGRQLPQPPKLPHESTEKPVPLGDKRSPTASDQLLSALSSIHRLPDFDILPDQMQMVVKKLPVGTFVFLAGVLCYSVARLSWGVLYTTIICTIMSLYFNRGMQRFKAHLEFKGDTEAGLRLLEKGEGETVEWLNDIVNQIWCTVDPSLLEKVAETIEDNLSKTIPPFVKSVHVKNFELGPMSPRISKIKVYPQNGLDADVVYGIVHFAFNPTANPQFPEWAHPAGMPTPPHMEIQLALGKAGMNVAVPIYLGLEALAGTIRFKVKLKAQPPFLRTAAFAFCGLPKLDVGVKFLSRRMPDAIKLPFFRDFVFKQAVNMAFDLFTEPNVVPIDVERIATGDLTEHELFARGVLRVTIMKAEGLRKADMTGDNDCFVTLSLYPTKPIAKTRVLMNDANPVWNETHYIVLSRDDVANHAILRAHVRDWDRLGPSDTLGYALLPVQNFCKPDDDVFRINVGRERPEARGPGLGCSEDSPRVVLDEATPLRRSVDSAEAVKGRLTWKVEWLPKLSLDTERQLLDQGKRLYSGVIGITIHQCGDLEIGEPQLASRPSIEGVNPYVKLYVNDEPVYRTRLKIHNPNPYFNAYTERFIRDWRTTRISAIVKDERQQEHDPVVGVVTIALSDVFVANQVTKETSRWWPLTEGIGYGKIRLSIVFRPIQLELPENELGYEVGTLVIDRIACHGLKDRSGHDLSFYVEVDLNFPVPGTHATPVAKKSSDPSWPDSVFSLPVQRRFQASLLIRLKRRGSLVLRGQTIARAELHLSRLVDGLPATMTLPLLPRGRVLRTKPGIRRADSSTSDVGMSDPPQPLAVRIEAGKEKRITKLVELEKSGVGSADLQDPTMVNNMVNELITNNADKIVEDQNVANSDSSIVVNSDSSNMVVDMADKYKEAMPDTLAVAKQAASSGNPTVTFRVAFLPGLAAVHKAIARDVEQAMEYAAVDASAIADDIEANSEEESWDPEAWADRDESGGISGHAPGWEKRLQPNKLPPYQKEVIVDPKRGTTEVRTSSYLATAASKAERSLLSQGRHKDINDTVKPLPGFAVKASSDSKGDLNLNPLSASGIVPSGTAGAGIATTGMQHGTNNPGNLQQAEKAQESGEGAAEGAAGGSGHRHGRSTAASTAGGSELGENNDNDDDDDDSIYFARGTGPLPDIHRQLSRHKFVRSLKWGADVVKHKVVGVKQTRNVRSPTAGSAEAEEL